MHLPVISCVVERPFLVLQRNMRHCLRQDLGGPGSCNSEPRTSTKAGASTFLGSRPCGGDPVIGGRESQTRGRSLVINPLHPEVIGSLCESSALSLATTQESLGRALGTTLKQRGPWIPSDPCPGRGGNRRLKAGSRDLSRWWSS